MNSNQYFCNMANDKYIFNHRTLSYEKYRISWKKRLLQGFSYLISTMVFALVIVLTAYNFFGSPKERMQAREIEYLNLQYEILHERLDKLNVLLADMQERDDNIYRVIFEADPIPTSVRQAGYGGVDRYDKLKGYQKSDMVIEAAEKLDRIASQLYVQSKSFDEVFDMARNKAEMLAAIPAIKPLRDYEIHRISSYFGMRMDPFYKVQKFHRGIDFSAANGTPIYATGDGSVVRLERSRRGYGNILTIDHGFGYVTRYAHLKEFKVRRGEKVKRGQLIATVGNTGKSTAPHLHYEVHKNGRPVNPIHFFFNDLTPEEYETILELSALPMQSMD